MSEDFKIVLIAIGFIIAISIQYTLNLILKEIRYIKKTLRDTEIERELNARKYEER